MDTRIYGPLQKLMDDENVQDVMVNRYDRVFAARQAFQIDDEDVKFESREQLLALVDTLTRLAGVEVSAASPIADVILPDETRVHIVMPPVAPEGPTLVLRRPGQNTPLPDWDTLVAAPGVPHVLNAAIRDFLQWSVKNYLNIAVVGGTGSGKLVLLNLLANEAHDGQRIITVEGKPDLKLQYKNLVRLHARPASLEGKGEITLHHLMQSALKMRPGRIICSQIYGEEIVDMLQAMNSGIEGSMFALHATSPRDALMRMELLATAASPATPLLTIRQQIASAIDLVIHMEILRDGWHKLMRISEVKDLKNGEIELFDIFEWVQTGLRDNGGLEGNRAYDGYFTATGHIPEFRSGRMKISEAMPPEFFTPPKS